MNFYIHRNSQTTLCMQKREFKIRLRISVKSKIPRMVFKNNGSERRKYFTFCVRRQVTDAYFHSFYVLLQFLYFVHFHNFCILKLHNNNNNTKFDNSMFRCIIRHYNRLKTHART